MIYILEGPDGVGKSTLASTIYDETKGHILHCTWKKEFQMRNYFLDVMHTARLLSRYQDVIIDRWAPSEYVYGNVFRGGPSFDVLKFVEAHNSDDIRWIMCSNENVVENHKKHMAEREEMFDDMSKVAEGFQEFVKITPRLNWIEYDYDKVDMHKFVKELVNG